MSQPAINRRQFLRGDLRGRDPVRRPPWALPEDVFLQRCTRCGDCVSACGEGIIRLRDGYPEVSFERAGCSFCGDCVEACKPAALNSEERDPARAWPWRAAISDDCLARRGVVCQSCGDVCEPRAIRFRPTPGGVSSPVLKRAHCTGCGECLPVCPSRSIDLNESAGEPL